LASAKAARSSKLRALCRFEAAMAVRNASCADAQDYGDKAHAERDQGPEHTERMRGEIAEDGAEDAADPHRKPVAQINWRRDRPSERRGRKETSYQLPRPSEGSLRQS
jgi:hypothetical protein